MQNKFIKLKNNVLITTVAMLTLSSILFVYLTINERSKSLNKELLSKKNQLELEYMKYIDMLKLKYSREIRTLQNDKKIIELFALRDRDKLNKAVQPYFEKLKKDEPNFELICFGLPNNKVFLRAHRPDMFGDDISNVQGVKLVNDTKREISGFMLTKLGLFYRINIPIYYKDKYIGIISFGINIGAVNDYISKNFNSDVAILINTNKYKNMPWYKRVEEGEIGKQTIINSTDDFIADNSKTISLRKSEKVKIDNDTYIMHQDNNIYDLNNHKIATILLIQNITEQKKSFIQYLYTLILITIVLISFILVILIKSFNKMIKKIISINNEVYDLNNTLEKKVKVRTKALNEQSTIAKKATKAKSDFLANMSHEIRTPLNAILGFLSLLKENHNEEDRIKYINIIDNSSHTLLGIINDILDMSKIESGKLTIDKIDFNPHHDFKSVAELFKAKAQEKNLEFVINIDKDIPNSLYSDSLRLKQIISNLLSNAIKFTASNKKISLDINYKDGFLNIGVKDEGIGISKEKQAKIFEPFSQAEGSTTRKFGGTGLGLSISMALVELLGGKLQLRSQLEVGSEFYFSIPVAIGKEIYKQSNKKNEQFQLNAHILLVEDNISNQMFMKIILKKMGLTFDISSDGYEAIDKFKQSRTSPSKKYDLILMDENMPIMGGIEATKYILKYEKENNLTHTPIIALTANALKGDRERFIKAGMDEYLSKPLDRIKLNEILNKVLEK